MVSPPPGMIADYLGLSKPISGSGGTVSNIFFLTQSRALQIVLGTCQPWLIFGVFSLLIRDRILFEEKVRRITCKIVQLGIYFQGCLCILLSHAV